MLKTGREKIILKQGLIVLGIIAGLYFFVLSPFLRDEGTLLDEELERKTIEINRYIKRTGALPSKESFERLNKERGRLEGQLDKILDFIDPEKTRVSDTSTEAGLYFIERLHDSIKNFTEKGESKGIKLPENLGFGDGFPKESMVDMLLRQLEIVEFALDTLLDSDNVEIYSIKPLRFSDYIEPLTKDILYTELPVELSFKAPTKVLAELLVGLKNVSPIVSVKEMHIKSNDVDRGFVEVGLVLSAFKTVKGS